MSAEAPRRILIAGVSGSGKSTLARRVAERLALPHVELDDLHWGPGWTTRDDFVANVQALTAREAWVTEWQYGAVRPLLAARAELIVILDLPTRVTMTRVIRRTVSRRIHRTPLWRAQLREKPLHTFFTDEDHIVRWAWRTRNKYRAQHGALADLAPGTPLIRLRTAREVAAWLDTL